MTKRKYGTDKPVGKAPERKCSFGEFCKPILIEATDPFSGETMSEVVCERCGKPY